MTIPAGLTTPPTSTLQKVNAYAKHAVGVAGGIAVAEGVLDPVTGAVHVSGLHALYLVLIGTAVSLLASYAGLGAPQAPKLVYLVPNVPPVAAPAALAAPGPIPPPTAPPVAPITGTTPQ